MILGTYHIRYDNGVTQTKNLLSHSEFLNVIKPAQQKAYDLEVQSYHVGSKVKAKLLKEAKEIKAKLVKDYGQFWFTDQSPLWKAHETRILSLPPHQGGDIPCQVSPWEL